MLFRFLVLHFSTFELTCACPVITGAREERRPPPYFLLLPPLPLLFPSFVFHLPALLRICVGSLSCVSLLINSDLSTLFFMLFFMIFSFLTSTTICLVWFHCFCAFVFLYSLILSVFTYLFSFLQIWAVLNFFNFVFPLFSLLIFSLYYFFYAVSSDSFLFYFVWFFSACIVCSDIFYNTFKFTFPSSKVFFRFHFLCFFFLYSLDLLPAHLMFCPLIFFSSSIFCLPHFDFLFAVYFFIFKWLFLLW